MVFAAEELADLVDPEAQEPGGLLQGQQVGPGRAAARCEGRRGLMPMTAMLSAA